MYVPGSSGALFVCVYTAFKLAASPEIKYLEITIEKDIVRKSNCPVQQVLELGACSIANNDLHCYTGHMLSMKYIHKAKQYRRVAVFCDGLEFTEYHI